MKNRFSHIIQVSRPGLWFATIWMYLLPAAGMDLTHSVAFWVGLFYVSFPLNLLVYGWNDIADFEIDQLNPRKGNFLFGARSTEDQIKLLPHVIIVAQIAFLPYFIFFGEWKLLAILLLMLVINWAYNKQPIGLRTLPPFELFSQIGYLLIVPFSICLNGIDHLEYHVYLYLFLFAMQSHMMGEVMDHDADLKTGRKTLVTQIGIMAGKMIIISIVVAEVLLMWYFFQDVYFLIFLSLVLLWLILDLFLIYGTRSYSMKEMKIFSLMSNMTAIATMAYLYFNGGW